MGKFSCLPASSVTFVTQIIWLSSLVTGSALQFSHLSSSSHCQIFDRRPGLPLTEQLDNWVAVALSTFVIGAKSENLPKWVLPIFTAFFEENKYQNMSDTCNSNWRLLCRLKCCNGLKSISGISMISIVSMFSIVSMISIVSMVSIVSNSNSNLQELLTVMRSLGQNPTDAEVFH